MALKGVARECIEEQKSMCLAIPGKIICITNDDPLFQAGNVDFGGILKEVNLSCVPEAGVGDYVIVHAGFAISTLNESEAERVFNLLGAVYDL